MLLAVCTSRTYGRAREQVGLEEGPRAGLRGAEMGLRRAREGLRRAREGPNTAREANGERKWREEPSTH